MAERHGLEFSLIKLSSTNTKKGRPVKGSLEFRLIKLSSANAKKGACRGGQLRGDDQKQDSKQG